MEKILIHTCCAPCLSYVFERLKDKFHIIAYFYNPNIHGFREYKFRKNALVSFCKIKNIDLIMSENYDFDMWLDYLKNSNKSFEYLKMNRVFRCQYCYSFRINNSLKLCKSMNIKYFTTTLFYSIYQNHKFLKFFCETECQKQDINLYYEDFRKGFKEGIDLYKKTELYMQNYCGCIFSENERFNKKFYKQLKDLI